MPPVIAAELEDDTGVGVHRDHEVPDVRRVDPGHDAERLLDVAHGALAWAGHDCGPVPVAARRSSASSTSSCVGPQQGPTYPGGSPCSRWICAARSRTSRLGLAMIGL